MRSRRTGLGWDGDVDPGAKIGGEFLGDDPP